MKKGATNSLVPQIGMYLVSLVIIGIVEKQSSDDTVCLVKEDMLHGGVVPVDRLFGPRGSDRHLAIFGEEVNGELMSFDGDFIGSDRSQRG